jgi:F420-dependent oxidoreductase-like protein
LRLGVHIGYWGLGLRSSEQLELVQEAERLGYDSIWTAEAYGSDAVTILAWMAAQTERIKLGSAILQMPARSAAMTAMTAATLDQLSGGRMLLGLGTSGPQVAEGWHGQRFARQLQRTREYVEVVRMALRRERLEYHGETLELPLPDGPGKALKLTIAPVQERIPIYIAAIGPKNTTLTAEIADGWIPTLFSPEHVAEFRPLLEEGFARAGAGKSPADFDVAPTVNVYVTDDREAARDAMRPFLALYVGGMGSREQNFYNRLVRRYGFDDAAREVQDLYLGGRARDAAAALPAELIDAVSLCGPADVVRERLALFRDAGVGTLIISPMSWSLEDRRAQLRLVAELAE